MIIRTYILLLVLILTACSGTTSLHPTSSMMSTQAPDDTAAAKPWDQAFVSAIYQRLEVDDTISEPGRQAAISMLVRQPTALFPDNQGLVLIFEVPGVPVSQEATTKTAVLLIGTAVSVAKDQNVPLSGVEVIFYANSEPFIGFRAVPPWSAQDITVAPLAEELKKKIEEKVGATPTPRPTAPLQGG